MDCEDYRRYYSSFASKRCNGDFPATSTEIEWDSHDDSCTECSDWVMAQEVIRRGHAATEFPCIHMAYYVTHRCQPHPEPHDCPDALVTYTAAFDEYAIPVRDGGKSGVLIRFCPWCGIRLPESKRRRWFEELEALGFDDPLIQGIPERYHSSAWYNESL